MFELYGRSMPPRKSNRHINNTPTTPPPLPQPPSMDFAIFQVDVIVTVAIAIAQISNNGTNGTENGTNSSNQGGSHGRPRACSYKDFLNCKPKTFYGNGGVISLTRWFKKTESLFEFCTCPEENKVKFVAYAFADGALSWWNSHVKSLTLPMANAISWEDLKIMTLAEYYPTGEV